ncbi:MAG: hypothetical protein U0V49_01890 [Saprospiraceae bacterium]
MKKMTICNAVIESLNRAGKPQTPHEILDLINKHELYQFNTKTPLNVLKAEIRKHTEGVELKEKVSVKYFTVDSNNKIWVK